MKTLNFFIISFALLNPALGQTETKQTFSIGDHYGGGIIFSVDPTGQHGLIAAPNDQPKMTCWGNKGWAGALYMNQGALNTEKIVAYQKTIFLGANCAMPAACMCDTLTLAGFTDWYLPSINELKDMYDKQNLIEGFVAGDYCSSTESSDNKCWNVHFRPSKTIIFQGKKFEPYSVRCTRKF